MTPDRWTRLATLVPDALELPPDQRGTFLDEACRLPTGEIDADLRAEADALVQSALDATDVDALESPLAGLAGELAGEEGLASVAPPETVGPWRVTGVLGEGGQAVVYRARRADGAFEREVALKLLRPGAPAPRLAARLAEERRVLARLEHPGIARLYDGGLTDDGQPFLAMELIDGAPITAAAATLDLRQQVELLAEVAEAVAYAHARLVVHRDLKPSNVLVTQEGRPRLLDFGVAKLLGGETDPDLTVPGWMTPAYAAPEQVAGGEVTTATDVYALGVLAYELLAGRRPYETAGLSPAETERLVCHADPPPASAAASGTRARALRGDLDTILAKALAKEPARRYPTASALADDLGRWLAGMPVEARPATARYRASRFVKRHRVAVIGTAAALTALAAVTGAAFARVSAERDRAETETSKAEAVNEFLVGIFDAADPLADGRDVRVADVLDRAAAEVDSLFEGQPDVEASVRISLGWTYRGLGLMDKAERQLRAALHVSEQAHGPRHLLVAEAQAALARLFRVQGAYAPADSLLTLALATTRAEAGERDPMVPEHLHALGRLALEMGQLERAEAFHREGLALGEAIGEAPRDLAISYANLADVIGYAGQYQEAADLHDKVLAMLRKDNAPPALIAQSLAAVAFAQADLGQTAEAIRVQEEAVALHRTAFGPEHYKVPLQIYNLATMYNDAERYGRAEALLRESIAITERVEGPDHPHLANRYSVLAYTLNKQSRNAEAERVARRALVLQQSITPPDSISLGDIWMRLATISLDTGAPARAERLARRALENYDAALPPDHRLRFAALTVLGEAEWRRGKLNEAEGHLTTALQGVVRVLGSDDPRVADTRGVVDRFFRETGRPKPSRR